MIDFLDFFSEALDELPDLEFAVFVTVTSLVVIVGLRMLFGGGDD